MQLDERDALTDEDWQALVDGEPNPWGTTAEDLSWGEKDRYLVLCDDDGRLVAAAGAVATAVSVAEGEEFEVVGLGGLFVHRSARGAGLLRTLAEPLLELAARMGPDRAMLFCREELTGVYGGLGFERIEAAVWAQQPAGEVEVPLAAMWRPLHGSPDWPAGTVRLSGLPF